MNKVELFENKQKEKNQTFFSETQTNGIHETVKFWDCVQYVFKNPSIQRSNIVGIGFYSFLKLHDFEQFQLFFNFCHDKYTNTINLLDQILLHTDLVNDITIWKFIWSSIQIEKEINGINDVSNDGNENNKKEIKEEKRNKYQELLIFKDQFYDVLIQATYYGNINLIKFLIETCNADFDELIYEEAEIYEQDEIAIYLKEKLNKN